MAALVRHCDKGVGDSTREGNQDQYKKPDAECDRLPDYRDVRMESFHVVPFALVASVSGDEL